MSPIEYITVLLGLLASIGAGMCLHLSLRLRDTVDAMVAVEEDLRMQELMTEDQTKGWQAELERRLEVDSMLDEATARLAQADSILAWVLTKWDYIGESAASFTGPSARGFEVERNSIVRDLSTKIHKHFDHPKPEMPAHTVNPLTAPVLGKGGLMALHTTPIEERPGYPGDLKSISDEDLLAEMDAPHTLPGAGSLDNQETD